MASTSARTHRFTSGSSVSCWRSPASARATANSTNRRRRALLEGELASPRLLRSPFAAYTAEVNDELAVLAAAADAVTRHGEATIPHYIVSGASSASDVLEALLLLREVGLVRPHARSAIVRRRRSAVRDDRRPRAGSKRPRRIALPAGLPPHRLRSWGLARGDDRLLRLEQGRRLPHFQLVVVPGPATVGGGRRSARRAAAACSTVAAARSVVAAVRRTRRSLPSRLVRLAVRSGSPSRARWWRRSTPSRPRRGAIWRPCWRRRSRPPPESTTSLGDDTERFATVMDELSATAHATYRSLVFGDDDFAGFFAEITPISEIATLNIGSSPASRTGSRRIEDLRAIPWVFGWTQCRVMLPGWFGCGSAFERFDDESLLSEMYVRWPFFRSRHRQPRHGPRQGRPRCRGALCRGTGR